MHFTEPVYRNPYWPTFPLIQITQGCTHNSCKFCTMYKDVPFRMQPMEWIEEDLKELRDTVPHAKTIQLLSANPMALTYDRLMPRLELIHKYLPELEHIYTATRVSDLKNKSVDELRRLRAFMERLIFPAVNYADFGRPVVMKKLRSATIYTMNCPNEAIYRANDYDILMDTNAHQLGMFGPTEILCSFDTLQFSDYNRYDADAIDAGHKKQVHDTRFNDDLQKAYTLGRRLVEEV